MKKFLKSIISAAVAVLALNAGSMFALPAAAYPADKGYVDAAFIQEVQSFQTSANTAIKSSTCSMGPVEIDQENIVIVKMTGGYKLPANLPHNPLKVVTTQDGYYSILVYAQREHALRTQKMLSNSPFVAYAEMNRLFTVDYQLTDTSESGVNAAPQDWGASAVHSQTAIDYITKQKIKRQVIVGVLDTGIDPNHPLFQGRLIETSSNFTSDPSYDKNGHGTHTAGIIAANTPAESVKICAVKVLSDDGMGDLLGASLGIIWAAQTLKADVISMSLGGFTNGEAPQFLAEAVDYAQACGVVLVAAAGNDSADYRRYMPGGLENIITVGALDKDLRVSYYSNFGPGLDLVAPGTGIISARAGNDGYISMDGTSMATPFVAAAAACARLIFPNYTYGQIESKLKHDALDLGAPGPDELYGFGLVDFKGLISGEKPQPSPESEPIPKPEITPVPDPKPTPDPGKQPEPDPGKMPVPDPGKMPVPIGTWHYPTGFDSSSGRTVFAGGLVQTIDTESIGILRSVRDYLNGQSIAVTLSGKSITQLKVTGPYNVELTDNLTLSSQSLIIESSLQLGTHPLVMKGGKLSIAPSGRLFIDGCLDYGRDDLDMTGIHIFQTGSLKIMGFTFFGQENAGLAFNNTADNGFLQQIMFQGEMAAISADVTVRHAFQFRKIILSAQTCLAVDADLYIDAIYGSAEGILIFEPSTRVANVTSDGCLIYVFYADGTATILRGALVGFSAGKVTYQSPASRIVMNRGGRILDSRGNVICDRPGTYTMTCAGWYCAETGQVFGFDS